MRKLLLLATIAVAVTLSSPSRAQFCPGAAPWVFDDVPIGDPFCGYITWAAQNGITLGCAIIDANHRLYCPSDPVRRDQMAAFVNRLGNVRVEAVGTGPGLTGGPITSVGTINLAATNLLPTVACATNQIPKWNGSAWVCAADANSGGTVTSVGSGTGLTGGPITSAGTLSIAGGYQLPQGCTNGQVAKSNGSNAWTCASDANAGGTVTSITAGNGLTGGTITTAGTIAVDPASTTLTSNFFKQGGNAFGATAVLGTTDNNATDIRVNGTRVMRYEPNTISPNVIGGSPANNATVGVRGATIGGGGIAAGVTDPDFGSAGPNRVTDAYGTVAGGWGNRVGDDAGTMTDRPFASIGGGFGNTASGARSTIGGGHGSTASGHISTIGGGFGNLANGNYSTIGGGYGNATNGASAAVSGGEHNSATGNLAAIGGGDTNTAGGSFATVSGGEHNNVAGNDGTVGGGGYNTASGSYSTIGGGAGNNGSGLVATIGGGELNSASGNYATIGGGDQNAATGSYSTVPGGQLNLAQGAFSLAAGVRAKATHDRAFVWGGSEALDTVSNNVGVFIVYAPTSVQMYAGTPGSGGCVLTSGASGWACSSDKFLKSGVAAVDIASMLERVVALPVSEWSFATVPGVMHVGPMAQDFHTAFGLGDDPTKIAAMDVQGVALAAIQGLNAKLEARVSDQAQEIGALRAEIAVLSRAVEILLARTSPEGQVASR